MFKEAGTDTSTPASPQSVVAQRAAESVRVRPDASFKIKDSFRQVSQPVVEKTEAVIEKQAQIEMREAFDEEKVMHALEKYISEHHPDPTVSIALKTHHPLVQGEKITVLVDNQLQTEKLEAIKQHLLNALMRSLNNGHIVLGFRLFDHKITNEDKKLFTASEKFEHFVKLNPVVADLKKIFGLELD